MQRAYVTHETLGKEQWFGTGWKTWQVIDPARGLMRGDVQAIVHEAEIVPIARRLRCRLWALLHGYGWLPEHPEGK